MKVVIDTNVLISSLFWNGHPHRIVDLAISQNIQSVTCLEILQEFESVLREDFQIPPARLKDILTDVLSYSQLVRIKLTNVEIRDLDDLKVIACALSAEADYIITGDKDLLTLLKVNNIKIVTPADFIKQMVKH